MGDGGRIVQGSDCSTSVQSKSLNMDKEMTAWMQIRRLEWLKGKKEEENSKHTFEYAVIK